MAETQHEADDGLSGPISGDFVETQTGTTGRTGTDEVCGIEPTGTLPEQNAWADNGPN